MRKEHGLWHVYLLECSDGSLYCGITTDLPRRLMEHNGIHNRGARYTGRRRPVVLKGCLPCRNRSAASRLEAKIKSLPKNKKLVFLGDLA